MNVDETAKEAGYKPGPIADVPDGIYDSFPPNGALHAYLWWASKTTDAPAYFHIASILSAACCELARRGWVIGHGQHYPPRLWTAMVAGPGVGKSTAINTAREFYTDACGVWGWPDPYITADGSTQGLFEAMARLHDAERDITCAILVREEFSVLLNAKRRDDLAISLCEWADGRHHQRHTRGLQQAQGRGEVAHQELRNAVISATFVTTERTLLDAATVQHMEGGLFSRLDWFNGLGADVVPKLHHTQRPVERAVALDLWKHWQMWLDSEELTLKDQPKIIEVSPECEKYLEETLFMDYERALNNQNPLTANYKRALTHAYVIAGVYAMSCARRQIQPGDMHRAVNLLNYCLGNIGRMAPEVGSSPLMRAANRAFETIRLAGEAGAPRTSLYRRLQVPKRELDLIIETLLDEGSIRETVTVSTGKPGRPAVRYAASGEQRYMGPTQEGKVIAFPVDATKDAK